MQAALEDIPTSSPAAVGLEYPSQQAVRVGFVQEDLLCISLPAPIPLPSRGKIFGLEFAFVTKRFSSGFHALGSFCTNYMCIAIKIAALPFTF